MFKQVFYSVQEAADFLNIPAREVIRYVRTERLPICFIYEGDLFDVVIERPGNDTIRANGKTPFSGTLKSLLPPENDRSLLASAVEIIEVFSQRFRMENGRTFGCRLPTQENHGGPIIPGWRVTGDANFLEVPADEWLIHREDIDGAPTAPAPVVPDDGARGASTSPPKSLVAWQASRSGAPEVPTAADSPTADKTCERLPDDKQGKAATLKQEQKAPIGIPKGQILSVDWPIPPGAPPLQKIIDNLPKWVEEACTKVGRVGKGPDGSHLWNPAILAACLATKTSQKQWTAGKGALTSCLRRSFPDYLEQWEEAAKSL
ncbi:MAG TPA: helix-turn-helix domain-containing protein [Accumulibacter sp.]|uniref:helix-turn-helix domain-containing protein n=1 Tax=Accumulibacter sp. TaxID=2053492 RepID=UPI002B9D9CDF|nr:helix-turn-helix domain-containing protein [Accumulibacter sp.]HRD87384.1 helix-turn-helix domain-containing protein [Accumulibacter sp.]